MDPLDTGRLRDHAQTICQQDLDPPLDDTGTTTDTTQSQAPPA